MTTKKSMIRDGLIFAGLTGLALFLLPSKERLLADPDYFYSVFFFSAILIGAAIGYLVRAVVQAFSGDAKELESYH